MRAVVTRPVEDAERIAAPLRERGVDVLIEPLLAVGPAAAAEAPVDDIQAFLLTSANGARALAGVLTRDAPHLFALPALCVGDQTQSVARDLGFTRVWSANGDVQSLAALVRERLTPARGVLFHAAGTAVAGDLQHLLQDDGFTVRRKALYETRTAKAFSSSFQTALRDGHIDAVLIYSPRTARTFADLATKADLRDACRGLTVYCLSPAVADALGELPFHRVRVAPEPNQEALLAVFDEDNAYAFARVPSQADSADAKGDGTMTQRPKPGQTGKTGASPEPEPKADPKAAKPEPKAEAKPESQPEPTPDPKAEAKAAPGDKGKPAEKPEPKPDAKAAAKPAGPTATPKSGAAAPASPAPTASPPRPTDNAPQQAGAETKAEPEGGTGVSGGVVGLLVVLIVLLAAWATLPLWSRALPEGTQQTLAPMIVGGGSNAVAPEQVSELGAQNARLQERLSAVAADLDSLQQRLADVEATPATDANGDLSAEAQATLDQLRQRIDQIAANQPQDASQEIAALGQRLSDVQASRAEASTVLNLTDRVAQLEQAVRQQEVRQARAVAFLVTVGQLRNAVDTGRPFADELRSARAVAPDGLDVAAAAQGWADRAADGVPTLTTLRQTFRERSDAIIRSSMQDDETAGWLDRTVDRMASVVSVRRTEGEAVGDSPTAIVSRVEQDLDAGTLSAAVAEVAKLQGPAAEVADAWLQGARARLKAEEGLAALTGEALARLEASQTPAAQGAPTAPAATANGQEG